MQAFNENALIDFSDESQVIYLRNKCLSDFLFYVRYFFKLRTGYKFIVADHHVKIARELIDVYLLKTPNLLVEMPPQSGKTEVIVVMFISWCFAKNPICKFIHMSASQNLVLENSYKIREIIALREYQALFGFGVRYDSKAKNIWKTDAGGQIYAVSNGGQVAGYPAGIIGLPGYNGALVIDDALKPDDKYSKKKKETANRRAFELIASRPATEITPVICVMQRITKDDLAGLLERGDCSRNFKVLKIKALENGKSFFPEKYSVETLLKIKEKNKWVFAAEFQQEPADDEGSIYKVSYWRYYTVLPKLEYINIFGDTAQKTGEENDYTVFQVWGHAEGRIYLLDQIREKLESPELKIKAIALYNKWKSRNLAPVRYFYVEDKVSGTGLIQEMHRRGGIPIKPIKRNKDKMTRAQDSVGQIEAGNVLLPEDADFLSDFLEEHSNFPNGEHDDQVDCDNDAIDIMLNSANQKEMYIFKA